MSGPHLFPRARRRRGRSSPEPLRRVPSSELEPVDVAIVAESTYPYLRGGVSAVIHQIVESHPELRFGVIHITWDRNSPTTDLYGAPPNVRWTQPTYLSVEEHRVPFGDTASGLPKSSSRRLALVVALFTAMDALLDGDCDPAFAIYDDGFNPDTRTHDAWKLLGTREFMEVAKARFAPSGLSVSELFWQCREFFSILYALLGETFPKADVYHSHTTGYAGLVGALAARQQSGRFFLTEHNLYVRDTVNTQIDRSMALPVTSQDWRTWPDLRPQDRAWCGWYTEMSKVTYESASVISYLYPGAYAEAAALGAPLEKARVIANGIDSAAFALAAERQIDRDQHRQGAFTRKLAYVARVVPIKGLLDLLEAVAILRDRDVPPFTLDVMGPNGEAPAYNELCQRRCRELGIADRVNFLGSQDLREAFGGVDVLVLPSHNEGQPIVVLEAMSVGLPVVGTNVGGMQQLVSDARIDDQTREVGACGLILEPHDVEAMVAALTRVLNESTLYAQLRANGPARVAEAFELQFAMDKYRQTYRDLAGDGAPVIDLRDADAVRTPERVELVR